LGGKLAVERITERWGKE
jgi:hypothetical protein